MVNIPWYRWGGGAAAGAVADYLDVRTKPVSTTLTNSELFAGLMLVADALGWGGGYRDAIHGAADWAAGAITAGIVRRRILPQPVATVVTTAPVTTSSTTTTTTTRQPVQTHLTVSPGVGGVPASAGSPAYDLPMGGY
jgi:hypothetical protein